MSRLNCCCAMAALAATLLAAGRSISLAGNNAPSGGPKSAGNDPFRVPDGTADELQKYIEGLKRISPPSSLRPVGAEFRRQRTEAQLAASEKMLTVKPVPTPDQVRTALRAKVAALVLLERLGDATATDKIEATLQQARQLTPLPPPPASGYPAKRRLRKQPLRSLRRRPPGFKGRPDWSATWSSPSSMAARSRPPR